MKKTEAIEAFGTATALADALGITIGAVSQWGDDVPELRVYQIREVLRHRAENAEASDNGDA